MSAEREPALRAFIDAMNELRTQVGTPSLRDLERQNPRWLRSSTLHGHLNHDRRRPPTWPLVDAFVRACLVHGRQHGVRLTDDEEGLVGAWLDRHRTMSAAWSQAPEPAPDDGDDSWPLIQGGGTQPVRGHFFGREELMADLETKMAAQRARPVCLLGPGGHGKTQLASEYIHNHLSRYAVIWWIRAEQPSLVWTDLASLGRRLDHGIADAEIVAETLKLLREDPTWQPWLLVFDNAAHPATLGAFLPGSTSGHVLITTRDFAWDEVADTIEVGVFSREDSVELLTRRVPGISDQEAAEVAEELGDLPLGIVQAGSYLKGAGLTPGAYLARLREQPGRMLDKHPPVDYGRGLASTWELGFETLRQTHPEALDLLRRCAFLRPESISRGLLVQGALPLSGESVGVFRDPLLADTAIRALTRYGFMRLAGRDTVQVHRLLQTTVKQQLSDEEGARMRHDVHLLLAGSDCGDPESRTNLYAELAGHAEASALADCADQDVRAFAAKLVRYFQVIGDSESAERYAGVVPETAAHAAGETVPGKVRRPAPAPAVRRGLQLVREMDGDDWERLINQVTTGDCTPIVGANVSRRKTARVRALSWEWADRLGYPFPDAWNFESVLNYAVTLPDRTALAEELMAALRREWEEPEEEDDDPYEFLAKIPATSYLTTCYHDQLTRALLQAGREPIVKVPPWRPELANAEPAVAPTPERPLVCHLAGSYEVPDSLVLSEGDRVKCLRVEYRKWSADILGALVTYPYLVLGYNPRSSSYGMLMYLLAGVSIPRRNTIALHDPDPGGMEEAARMYHLARISRLDLRAAVYWGDARDFIRELSRRLEVAA
ncbi:FxSxx-COOH system tetratricopeptide repeat protein [Nonomuraea sp. B12E4]|uniref:FxSxx-COOH system tetratricopeptide repeat protein n=1 Tax=Nonomuraea sp. B12E4 TaxID=3153564 RepID=UPI00325F0C7F